MAEFKLDLPPTDGKGEDFEHVLGIPKERLKILTLAVSTYIAGKLSKTEGGVILAVRVPEMLRVLAGATISQAELLVVAFMAAEAVDKLRKFAADGAGKDLSRESGADRIMKLMDELQKKTK